MQNVPDQIFCCGFEVFGKVQGVHMRRQTRQLAMLNNVRGWVMRTKDGTVMGQLEGTLPKVNDLKYWLLNFGSPRAIIERAEFTPTREIAAHTYTGFTIRYQDMEHEIPKNAKKSKKNKVDTSSGDEGKRPETAS